jgi:heterodisulfide reductase subunit A-like polyferredoxin
MNMQNTYDLAVIGGGRAGIVGATTATPLGAKAVIIDRDVHLGGPARTPELFQARPCAKRRSRCPASVPVICTESICQFDVKRP